MAYLGELQIGVDLNILEKKNNNKIADLRDSMETGNHNVEDRVLLTSTQYR